MDREQKETVQDNAAVKCTAGLTDSGERLDRRFFSRRIKRDFRTVRQVYTDLCKSSREEAPVPLLWLWDNYYIIEGGYEEFRAFSGKMPRIPVNDGFPRIYTATRRFLNLTPAELSGKACSDMLSALSDGCTLGLREYFSAKPVIFAALISECSEILRQYCIEAHSVRKANAEIFAEKLGRIINSLRSVSYHDFTDDILSCRCAEILSRDPSGAFPYMTPESKLLYLSILCRNAEREGISERSYAKQLLERARSSASEHERHIGYPLFRLPQYRKTAYFVLLAGGTALFALLLALFVSPLCLIGILPIWEAVRICVDFAFSKAVKPVPLPRMELESIPENAAVLVVITSLLLGERQDSALFDRLEKIYAACGEENVYFGILADLADSKSATAPDDDAVISHAYGRIDALKRKYGSHFILFERRRSYSKSEEAFMGWERKRGAVVELVRFLKGKSTTFGAASRALAEEVLGKKRIKYVITLDADTNLPLGAVRNMCSAMLHPLAKPVIDKEKGIVSEGYGIMQPRCTPELSAAGATPFTRLMCGAGGSNIYSNAAFDVYQSIFGEGIFCGKGIFDVDAFDYVIDTCSTFPEDRILSHDCLEGAKLRAALISDLELTDGFPKNELSYSKRRHRWVRGDTQNLAYLAKEVRGSSGERYRNSIGALSRFKLFDNARNAAVPIFAYACVMLSAFTENSVRSALLVCALLYLALPVILETVFCAGGIAAANTARRFFSRGVTAGFLTGVLRMLYLAAELPQAAFSCADAILRSLYRMFISGKALLEWQTAAQSDAGSGGLLMFVYKTIFSAFSGFLLFVFAPGGILRALSLLWFAFPVIAYHMSFDRKKTDSVCDSESKELYRKYAEEIWRFYDDYVTESESFLPPDNIMTEPEQKTAHRTSPTNIGLYLLSALSARDLGIIGTDELYRRVSDTVSTLERLEKYRGHLYNWYDTQTLAVLPPRYISTVDSGNLTACLITLTNGLSDYVFEETRLIELIRRVSRLENATDYSFLYNRSRNLFVLGASVSKNGEALPDSGCFDLLMSEARTLSFIECAKRNVPAKHWSCLARPLITKGGYIGLYSWTGTAFEYFMPALFLPTYRRSLTHEALYFALKAQRARTVTADGVGLWGISESGYSSLDSSGNYCYRAFGIPLLGLKSGLERELVLSPYSSFIALCVNKKAALSNLSALKKAGFSGKYGFYEAIDFTPGRAAPGGSTVKSFMSHHLGMSMCALCNAAMDSIHVRRFMSDIRMACAKELLQEKIPVNARVQRPRKRGDIPGRSRETLQETEKHQGNSRK